MTSKGHDEQGELIPEDGAYWVTDLVYADPDVDFVEGLPRRTDRNFQLVWPAAFAGCTPTRSVESMVDPTHDVDTAPLAAPLQVRTALCRRAGIKTDEVSRG